MPINSIIGLLLLLFSHSLLAIKPQIQGYGIQSCSAYQSAFYNNKPELKAYQHWFNGFISGLNLATNQAILADFNWQQISSKLALQCEDQRHSEFIDAVRVLVRLNSKEHND